MVAVWHLAHLYAGKVILFLSAMFNPSLTFCLLNFTPIIHLTLVNPFSYVQHSRPLPLSHTFSFPSFLFQPSGLIIYLHLRWKKVQPCETWSPLFLSLIFSLPYLHAVCSSTFHLYYHYWYYFNWTSIFVLIDVSTTNSHHPASHGEPRTKWRDCISALAWVCLRSQSWLGKVEG